MKKTIRIYMFIFLLGIIMFGGMTTAIAFTIFTEDISFVPANNSWAVDNVEDAINDLYDRAIEKSTISSGEAWCIANKNIKAINNLSIYQFNNIDLTEIKSITYHFEGTASGTGFLVRDSSLNTFYEGRFTSTPVTLDLEQYKEQLSNSVILQLNISPNTSFYIDDYTKY